MTYDLNRFFEVSVDLLCIAGTDGYFKKLNSSWEKTLGWSQEELMSKPFLDFVHPDDRERTLQEVARLEAGATTLEFDNRYQASDGSYRWLRWAAFPEQGLLYSVARDITAMREAEERLRLVLESSPIAMVCVRPGGEIFMINRTLEALTGYQRKELLGGNIEMLVPEGARGSHRESREGFFQAPAVRPMGHGRDLALRRKDGSTVPTEIGLTPVDEKGEAFVLAAVVDLTERKRAEGKIRKQAQALEEANAKLAALVSVDALTGLKNRRYFFEHLERHIRTAHRRGTTLSIAMLDVDRFKSFNDSFGHQAGDDVLKQVSTILRETARTTDTVARYGGEEFVIALPETDSRGATMAAERFRRNIETSPWPHRDLTISLGVATALASEIDCEQVEDCAERLVGEADRALYHSKQNGRNRVTHAGDIPS